MACGGIKEKTIWQGPCFEIRLPSRPHVDRQDGGHLVVYPKRNVGFRSELSILELHELAILLSSLESAYINALRARGLDVVWLNLQDNGNWSLLVDKPRNFHVHLYGRCLKEVNQSPGQALNFPDPSSAIYDSNEQLNEDDIDAILCRLEQNLRVFNDCDFDLILPLGIIKQLNK